jgi:hypothetical protein
MRNRLAGLSVITFNRDRKRKTLGFQTKEIGNINGAKGINEHESVGSRVNESMRSNTVSIVR